MKRNIVSTFMAIVIMTGISSCNSNASNNDRDRDTSIRSSTDTTVIPGTPGPSGSQPRSSDTTQAHRDSLKHEGNLSDTSKRARP